MRRQRYRSGPLVWLAILFFTCLLLFLFQKILWLVVPFLLALIGYYLFFPLAATPGVGWHDTRYVGGFGQW
ncbi:hypothetical protein [Propionivibrio sp.]|uniref:hypothetical protein n=1 Tax=Propionivibrio sp. TaxID=2212460 RepID=UPI0025EC2762|nr:hypothetical protein [Propionivibrio sp.]